MSERLRRPGMFEHEAYDIWLVIVLIGLLAAIAIPLYNNIQQHRRIAKAQADVKTIADAIEAYRKHTGRLPAGPRALATQEIEAKGLPAGPFLPVLPVPPSGWSRYHYEPRPDGTFVISASGDNTTARAP